MITFYSYLLDLQFQEVILYRFKNCSRVYQGRREELMAKALTKNLVVIKKFDGVAVIEFANRIYEG